MVGLKHNFIWSPYNKPWKCTYLLVRSIKVLSPRKHILPLCIRGFCRCEVLQNIGKSWEANFPFHRENVDCHSYSYVSQALLPWTSISVKSQYPAVNKYTLKAWFNIEEYVYSTSTIETIDIWNLKEKFKSSSWDKSDTVCIFMYSYVLYTWGNKLLLLLWISMWKDYLIFWAAAQMGSLGVTLRKLTQVAFLSTISQQSLFLPAETADVLN